jgi:hypothetical protein
MNELQRLLAGKKAEEEQLMSEEVMSQGTPAELPQVMPEVAPEEVERAIASVPEAPAPIAPVSTPEDKISPEMQKYKDLIGKYESMVNAPAKETSTDDKVMNWITGIGQAANVYNEGNNVRDAKVKYWGDSKQKQEAAAKKEQLSGLDNLRDTYQKYMELQAKQGAGKKGAITEYQKAQLEQQEKNRQSRSDIAKITAKSKANEGKKQSEGDKTIDREFGKKYSEWNTGGKADYEVNSKIFKEAIKGLEDKDIDTGFFAGIGSEVPGMRTDTRETEDKVRKAINGMLRATLGSQFTEKEGERIFRQTFDPYASEDSNVERMNMELAKLEKRKDAMVEMGAHYRENKTMEGYEPKAIEDTTVVSKVKVQTPDGKVGNIPKEKLAAFMKKYPTAKVLE